MLYFIYRPKLKGKGLELSVVADTENDVDQELVRITRQKNPLLVVSRGDIKTYTKAEGIAKEATALTEKLHIAVDSGPYVSPRYDVIEAPKVGDKVSYAFNGDYYPCGEITKISASMRRIEATETFPKVNSSPLIRVFYRRRLSGSWIYDGTWSMVQGHIYKQNPSF